MKMKYTYAAVVAATLAIAALVTLSPAAHAAAATGVAWQTLAVAADVDRYFASAKAEKRPVLLYWGAKWCPPCNQLKATLFNRADFIQQSRSFMAVEIDGEALGAQRLGARFKVSGYPTLILFNPEGQELTRLPGEADAEQVMRVLQVGLSSGRPIKAVLADAIAGKKLSNDEWRLLGFYGWETDEQQLVSSAERARTLAQLAAASEGSDHDTSSRLWLKSIASLGKDKSADPAQLPRLRTLLNDPVRARAQMDVLTNEVPELVSAFAPQAGELRDSLGATFDGALKRLSADQTLSRADRLMALLSCIELARMDAPRDELRPAMIPSALLAEAREQVAQADREVTNAYERQAIVTLAASVLSRAGLWAESDQLLKASLARSHSSHYLMGHLGRNAMQQGRKADALQWYKGAFNSSDGPAMRVRWGSSYLSALMRLSPEDTAGIESAATQIFNEAGKDPGAFYGGSESSL